MSVEVWLRNPDNYMREVIDVGHQNLVWDFGVLRKRAIDPFKMCNLYYGVDYWRAMVIKNTHSYLLDREHSEKNPVAVWPTWEYGQPWSVLQKLVENPWSSDVYQETDDGLQPVADQEHRVIITRLPNVSSGPGKQFVRQLSELQEEHPEVVLHIHALYSFRVMFGLNFKSVDYEARTQAATGEIVLPSGKKIKQPSTSQQSHWIELIGMRPVELKIPQNRCKFNIKSAVWAGEYYKQAIKFKTRGFAHLDPDNPFKKTPRSSSIFVKRMEPSPGDKWLCNMCNLQVACKYFREGGICIVPESEPVELARFFKTRDADSVIEALGTLLATQSHRLKKAIETEEVKDELHPETTKIINTLFDRGVKLAKLLDPALAASGAPHLTQTNLTQINGASPQELMAAIVEELVKKGIPRSQITPDMIQQIIEKPDEVKTRAIDVASSES